MARANFKPLVYTIPRVVEESTSEIVSNRGVLADKHGVLKKQFGQNENSDSLDPNQGIIDEPLSQYLQCSTHQGDYRAYPGDQCSQPEHSPSTTVNRHSLGRRIHPKKPLQGKKKMCGKAETPATYPYKEQIPTEQRW